MKTAKKNLLIALLSLATASPAFVLLFSPAPVAAEPERQGVVTVGEMTFSAPAPTVLPEVVIAAPKPIAKRAARPATAPAERPNPTMERIHRTAERPLLASAPHPVR